MMRLRIRKLKSTLKLHTRYLLTVVNENSLAPLFSFSMRRGGLVVAVASLALLSGVIWYALFRFTPLRALLPMHLDKATRDDLVTLAFKTDSISQAFAINEQYVRNIQALLGDSLPEIHTDSTGVNLYDLPLDSLMTAGKAEERFVKQFEASERYNLSVLAPIAAEGMVFYPPIAGVSLKSDSGPSDLPAVTVNNDRAVPVSSVYRGTVVDAYYSADKGVTVVVQHPNNFISQYSGIGDVFVARGDKVSAGSRIGMSAGSRYPLTFILWHEGTALDPDLYIQSAESGKPEEMPEPFMPTRRSRR